MEDDDYRELQNLLLDNPALCSIIKDGGGIRKMRFGLAGSGKSGGVRVIYYWIKDN